MKEEQEPLVEKIDHLTHRPHLSIIVASPPPMPVKCLERGVEQVFQGNHPREIAAGTLRRSRQQLGDSTQEMVREGRQVLHLQEELDDPCARGLGCGRWDLQVREGQ